MDIHSCREDLWLELDWLVCFHACFYELAEEVEALPGSVEGQNLPVEEAHKA